MKIILESELERYAWGVMMAAHYKWEKNYGDSLQRQMDTYFHFAYEKETEEVIKKEVEHQLRDMFGEEFFLSEDEYVKSGLEDYGDDEMTDDEKQKLERDLRDEYRSNQEDIAEKREYMPEDVVEDLRKIYFKFFNAPENLTVIFNDEVIQGAEK
jgi:hypothetical protein